MMEEFLSLFPLLKMSKRFTDTDKWNNKWFRHLTYAQKYMYLYLCDKCDIAGFLEIDEEHMAYEMGVPQDKIIGAIKGLTRGCLMVNEWVFLPDFLYDQKNAPLKSNNNVYNLIMARINAQMNRFSILSEFNEIIGAMKGVESPLGIGIGNSKGIGKEESAERNQLFEDLYPFEQFWKDYDKSAGKSKVAKKWQSLSDPIKLLIKDHVPKYVISTPDKSKRKNPETYLNNEGWMDEIIVQLPLAATGFKKPEEIQRHIPQVRSQD